MKHKPTHQQPPADPTPYNHDDDNDPAGILRTILDVFRQLDDRLRPLTGHINTHGAPADRVSMATYSVDVPGTGTNPDPIQICGNLPAGIAHSVVLKSTTSCYIGTTAANAASYSSSFQLPGSTLWELPVASDLWVMFEDDGAYTGRISVAVLSWDTPR